MFRVPEAPKVEEIRDAQKVLLFDILILLEELIGFRKRNPGAPVFPCLFSLGAEHLLQAPKVYKA
jgi:hypothetical protein